MELDRVLADARIALRQADLCAARACLAEVLEMRWSFLAKCDARATRRLYAHQTGIARCLDGLAAVAAATGALERAARLFGAADELWNTLADEHSWADGDEPACDLGAVRPALSQAELAAGYEQGRAMPQSQTIDEALQGEVASW